jgi:hypothetical protein
MSKEIKLPSGNSATLKDVSLLKHKDRKKVLLSVGNDDIGIATGLKIIDGLLAMLIEEWTFDYIIPSVKLASLDELSIADYDALAKEAEEAQKQLFPRFGQDDGDLNNPKGS